MPAGYPRGSDLLRVLVKTSELEPIVATNARVGRATGVVLRDEVIDDPREFSLEVHHVKRDLKGPGDLPGIIGIAHRTASLLADPKCALLAWNQLLQSFTRRAEAHKHTHDFVAFFG